MKLDAHDLDMAVKFFGIYLNGSGKYLPIIVSINQYGITHVTFYKELTENLS